MIRTLDGFRYDDTHRKVAVCNRCHKKFTVLISENELEEVCSLCELEMCGTNYRDDGTGYCRCCGWHRDDHGRTS